MSNAHHEKQLHAVTVNQTGTLADISQWLADKGINIRALCAYVDNGRAHFCFITADNRRAMELFRARGLEVTEEEVVAIELQNRPGALKDMCKKLKQAEVDIIQLYASSHQAANIPTLVVFRAQDNNSAINALNS